MNTRASTQSQVPRLRISLPLIIAGILLTGTFAQAVDLSVPDVVFAKNQTVLPGDNSTDLPILIDGVLALDNVTSVDLVITYDSAVAQPQLPIITAGTEIATWFTAANVVDVPLTTVDELRISAASSTALGDISTPADLLIIQFTTEDTSVPVSTAITFDVAELNEALVSVNATDGSISLGGSTGVLSITPQSVPANPGVTIDVALEDHDLETQGSVTVRIVNTSVTPNDVEDVILTEDPLNLGNFAGSIVTTFDPGTVGNPGDTVFGVKAGDSVTAEYDDALNTEGEANTLVNPAPGGEITIGGGDTGVLSITPQSVPANPGVTIDVTLEDHDLETQGSVTVRIVNTSVTPNDVEDVILTEDPLNLGNFAGSIVTTFDPGTVGNPGDTVFGVKAGDSVTAEYDDALNTEGEANTLVNPAPGGEITIGGGDTGVLSITPQSVPANPGVTIDVALEDHDLETQGSVTVRIVNTSVTPNDVEDVILTEDPLNLGNFAGSIVTTFDPGTVGNPGDTVFGVKAGDSVTAEYDDALNTEGEANTLVNPAPGGEITIGGGDTGVLSITPQSVPAYPGVTIDVALEDHDLETQGSVTVRIVNTSVTPNDVEDVILTEDPLNLGNFAGSIVTTFDPGTVGNPGDTVFGVKAGDSVTAEYDDALNTEGEANTIVNPAPGGEIIFANGVTGVLTVSQGVQAGEGFRIRLVDADHNTTGGPDEVDVEVENMTNLDIETVTLTETDVDSGIFEINPGVPNPGMPTLPGLPANDGILQIGDTDPIEVRYDDIAAQGEPIELIANSFGVLWGDTSKSGTVSSLDASLILSDVVGLLVPPLDGYQLLVGDVNPSAVGYPDPIPDDASQILRFVVELPPDINDPSLLFPVQESPNNVPNPHPYKVVPDARSLALGPPETSALGISVPIVVSEVDGLYAGSMTLGFDSSQYEVGKVSTTDETSDFLVASNVVDGRLMIAFAGAESSSEGSAAILTIPIEPLPNARPGSQPFEFEEVSFNGGTTTIDVVDNPAAFVLPSSYTLWQNWPNPFNPETQIRYNLPEESFVELIVYDLLGQTVRTLVFDYQQTGSYTMTWDGRNNSGYEVAGGVYLYSLQAGEVIKTRKMALIR